ncbi:MAG: hypothetical protein NVS9B7_16320 [Flavisolibacter sp.]
MKSVHHLCALGISTIILGLIYLSVQQVYRNSANDPQVQLAHEIGDRLNHAKSLDKYFNDTTDLMETKSVFLEIYNAQGHPLLSNALLNGRFPELPMGVLNFVKQKGEDWVTWQPNRKLRLAMVIVSSTVSPHLIVAVGRTLQETENRVSALTHLVVIGWILCLVILLANIIVSYFARK